MPIPGQHRPPESQPCPTCGGSGTIPASPVPPQHAQAVPGNLEGSIKDYVPGFGNDLLSSMTGDYPPNPVLSNMAR